MRPWRATARATLIGINDLWRICFTWIEAVVNKLRHEHQVSHPAGSAGEILREDFLVPHKMSPGALAKRLGCQERRSSD